MMSDEFSIIQRQDSDGLVRLLTYEYRPVSKERLFRAAVDSKWTRGAAIIAGHVGGQIWNEFLAKKEATEMKDLDKELDAKNENATTLILQNQASLAAQISDCRSSVSRRITDVELLVERHAGRYSAARLMWASIFIGSLAFGVLAGVAAVRLGSPPSRLAAAEESAQVFMLDNQTEEHIQGWYEMQKQSGPVRRKKGE